MKVRLLIRLKIQQLMSERYLRPYQETIIASAHSLSYYPTDYLERFREMRDVSLKVAIRQVLVYKHVSREGKNDILVVDCRGQSYRRCYGQEILDYTDARKILFGRLHLKNGPQGYYIRDVYCGKEFNERNAQVGIDMIPTRNKLNCEHTWPQSKFNSGESLTAQKTDLHHLFPTDARTNSARGNSPFGEGDEVISHCPLSKRGFLAFEPPDEHKGNAARAIFYFSLRYNLAIDFAQEKALKRWHERDPVDEEEQERNRQIYLIQKIRNPFIDFPQLVGRISDF